MEKVETEILNFLKVWIIVVASLTYCYFISSKFPKGKLRLISLFPVILIFALAPLIFSSFFLQFYFAPFLGWLANFKLILFAFGRDDTLSINPSISLLRFILATAIPIKIKLKNVENDGKERTPSSDITRRSSITTPLLDGAFFINLMIWHLMIQLYIQYKEMVLNTNPIVIHLLYSGRMLFGIQTFFVLYGAVCKYLLGQELEQQFNNPHLSSSIQDFWGKRWNLMVSDILKSTIHVPTKSFFTPILGNRWSLHCAILVTYLISGLMHELIHFYVGRRWPTWEVTWFFIIHGVCLVIEIEVKKISSKRGWKLHPFISTPLTVAFVITTGIWLCYAELIHWGADAREIHEYRAFGDYVKRTYYFLVKRCLTQQLVK